MLEQMTRVAEAGTLPAAFIYVGKHATDAVCNGVAALTMPPVSAGAGLAAREMSRH